LELREWGLRGYVAVGRHFEYQSWSEFILNLTLALSGMRLFQYLTF
jgi:hypothetical protein